MLRAIIFFAVFTIITTAAPTPVQETPNEFYDARNGGGVDKNPLLHVRNKNNEIMENWPLNGYINFETSRGRENVNDIFEETTEDNVNSVEKNPSKIHHSVDHNEDIKDNLVDSNDEISSNYKESVFITFFVEFVKAIAEQIMAAYKS